MKKDITIPKVEDIAVAVVPEEKDGEKIWNAYLVNLKASGIETVLITSKGYGLIEDKEVKTSTLRQLLGNIEGSCFKLIEPMDPKLFGLNNEFLLSFWHQGKMYDKKYVFVPESIIEANFTNIPLLNKRGVMIR